MDLRLLRMLMIQILMGIFVTTSAHNITSRNRTLVKDDPFAYSLDGKLNSKFLFRDVAPNPYFNLFEPKTSTVTFDDRVTVANNATRVTTLPQRPATPTVAIPTLSLGPIVQPTSEGVQSIGIGNTQPDWPRTGSQLASLSTLPVLIVTEPSAKEKALGITGIQKSTVPPPQLTQTQSVNAQVTRSPAKPFSQLFSLSSSNVPNRVKGKPTIMCMPEGIMFIGQTFFPFFGRVFAKGKENNPKCTYTINGGNSINATFTYAECGLPVTANVGDANFQVEVAVSYERENRVQTFLTRCLSQKLHYATDDLPKRIEEALEELKLVPIKVESRAPMPQCLMRVVEEATESEDHKYGPSNGTTVRDAYIGQMLRMEFSLNPSSEAFGFLIKNCTVLDRVSGERYTVLDNKGCSTDINIFAHPHYDTYHDLALVHWHAFRIPDNSVLSFQCDCVVCSEIVDDDGKTSCEQIPTPPICPEVVTSAALQNALLLDFSDNNQIFFRKRSLDVNTSVCLGDSADSCLDVLPEKINDTSSFGLESHVSDSVSSYCLSVLFLTSSLSFSFILFLFALSTYLFWSVRLFLVRKDKTRIVHRFGDRPNRWIMSRRNTRSTLPQVVSNRS